MKPLILVYHRIADVHIDPWRVAVSPRHFSEHLGVLRSTRRPMPLHQFVGELLDHALPDDAVAVTFDDGYVDNLYLARPRLEAADIPATVFLATGWLGSREPFWWDELAELLLLGISQERLPAGPFGSEEIVLGPPVGLGRMRTWRSFEGPIGPRTLALNTLWQQCLGRDAGDLRATMESLRGYAAPGFVGASGRPLTSSEVGALFSDALITAGAHSATHRSLPMLTETEVTNELEESRAAVERLTGARVRAFAYPYGDHDPNVRKLARVSGYSFALGVQSSPVLPSADIMALPRVHVPDVDGDLFEALLDQITAAS